MTGLQVIWGTKTQASVHTIDLLLLAAALVESGRYWCILAVSELDFKSSETEILGGKNFV
jgi:hypothetical protein